MEPQPADEHASRDCPLLPPLRIQRGQSLGVEQVDHIPDGDFSFVMAPTWTVAGIVPLCQSHQFYRWPLR